FAARLHQAEELEEQMNQLEIWNNTDYAQSVAKKAAAVRTLVRPWQMLSVQLDDINELMELGDSDLLVEFETQVTAMEQEFAKRKNDMLFSGSYDGRQAVVPISAGAGGLAAQYFAQLLVQMYLRSCEQYDIKSETLELLTNDEAGI